MIIDLWFILLSLPIKVLSKLIIYGQNKRFKTSCHWGHSAKNHPKELLPDPLIYLFTFHILKITLDIFLC